MRFLFSIFTATLIILTAHAESLSNGNNYGVTEPEPELVFHTAAPGMIVMPRIDMTLNVFAYDVTILPREDQVYFRWRVLDHNGEGQGFWTRWREYDEPLTFSTPGIYVIETYAQAIGKEESSRLNATFKVDYLGMTLAPGISITPFEERGYYISFTSLYGDDIYYRWRHRDETWNRWLLYREPLPYTSIGNYEIEAYCDADLIGAYVEVPFIDYYKTGDVNHDNVIDISDVTTLIDMLLSGYTIGTGDVNKDGQVNISDVTTLIDLLLNNN